MSELNSVHYERGILPEEQETWNGLLSGYNHWIKRAEKNPGFGKGLSIIIGDTTYRGKVRLVIPSGDDGSFDVVLIDLKDQNVPTPEIQLYAAAILQRNGDQHEVVSTRYSKSIPLLDWLDTINRIGMSLEQPE